ncbi:MAG: hypothetical protein RL740_811, partial [Actinomycetota bacterium]
FAQAQKAMKVMRSGGTLPGMPPIPAMPGGSQSKPPVINKKKSRSGNPAKRAAEEQ